jgi:hypothetical protein
MRNPRHEFSARVEQVARGGFYAISIPAAVSRAIGRRGNVPIVATINGAIEVRASLVPAGGGRHRLRLNATTRKVADAALGARVDVVLEVDLHPVAEPTPPDLARALRDSGALEAFELFPVGKRSHIIRWIEDAARPETREKRVIAAVDVALRARDRRAHPRASAPSRRSDQKGTSKRVR